MAWLRDVLPLSFAALLALVVAIHLARFLVRWFSRRALRITYAAGPTIALKPGMTLLELSRSAGIPHASVCGGRGRCSTCRVRVLEGLNTLPPPAGAEAITLRSVEAPANVRLACQIRPTASLVVAPISAPATPAPVRLEFSEIKEIVAAHVRATLTGELVDLPTSDPKLVADWLSERITYEVPAAPASAGDFGLIGARIEFLSAEQKAVFVYQAQSHVLDIFVLPTDASRSTDVRGRRNGYSVLAWSTGKLTYFAVSDVPADTLEEIEECLRVIEAA
jgi:ferredoxin